MRVVITGAAGFVASGVARALAEDPACLGAPVTDLVLTDLTEGRGAGRWITGDLADPSHIAALLAEPADVMLHLASVPGGLTEQTPTLGRAVNLDATMSLMAGLADQHRSGGPLARVVFSSSIAVMGPLGKGAVNETHPAAPAISYGAHKLITEIDIADLTRRGEIDGVSLRLPGIVARPAGASGFGSAFMSELFHAAANGGEYACPVSPDATAWWMSRHTVIANILHAARMDTRALAADRALLLPALHASVADLIDGLAAHYGAASISGISHAPENGIEAVFGRFPAIDAGRALSAGFTSDADIPTLIGNVGVPAREAVQ